MRISIWQSMKIKRFNKESFIYISYIFSYISYITYIQVIYVYLKSQNVINLNKNIVFFLH